MVEIKTTEHVAILGATGSGKSIFSQFHLLPGLLKAKKQVIVILDAKKEYSEVPNVVYTPAELNEFLYGEKKPQGKIVRIVTEAIGKETAEAYLESAWAPYKDKYKVKSYEKGWGVRFLIEDMPIYYNSPSDTPPVLMKWVALGRAYRRTIIGTTQRTQLVPKTPLTMIEHLFVFRIHDYDRKQFIKQYYGDKASSALTTLPKWGYAVLSEKDSGTNMPVPIMQMPTIKGVPKWPKGVEI